VLESLAAGGRQTLHGPGAMALDESLATPPPRWAERGAVPAKIVVAICLAGTLWLGIGPTIGPLPGLERVLEWAAAATESLR
jgi:hypothetical protein